MELNFNVLCTAFEWIQIFVLCYLVRLGNKVQKYKMLLFFLIMLKFIKVGKACK